MLACGFLLIIVKDCVIKQACLHENGLTWGSFKFTVHGRMTSLLFGSHANTMYSNSKLQEGE